MLDDYFVNPRTLTVLRLGPLGQFMDDLSQQLSTQQYSRGTARSLLHGISHLSRYMLWRQIENVTDIRMEHINDFLIKHLPVCSCYRPNSNSFDNTAAAVKYIVVFLRNRNYLQEGKVEYSADSVAGILLKYQEHLRTICALAESSIVLHTNVIKYFLNARIKLQGKLELTDLTKKNVIDLVTFLLSLHPSADWKSSVTSCTRSFLRFLMWERIISEDFRNIVPSVIHWRLQEIPQAITEKQLEQLLSSPNRDTPAGRRDYAVLVLLASMGLRASEIVDLKLENIRWRKRSLLIEARKTRRERELPMPDIALHALQDYVCNARPQSKCRQVFLKLKAPIQGFSGSGAVTTIVTQHVIRSGIQTPTKKGPHMLRHTFATLLVNKGTSFYEVSKMLGHMNIQTTTIYSKVDLTSLRNAVLPIITPEKG